MKTAEILCVGTEILIGDIINTNAAYLSAELAGLGISQYHQAVIGDNSDRLEKIIVSTLENCDLLIMTGGLGPTYDDITKEVTAKAIGKKLVLDGNILADIKKYFESRGRKMSASNEKQAYVIEDAHVLKNSCGTAPGMLCELENGKIVVMLPGPPSEMKPMWEKCAKPIIQEHCEGAFVSKNINIIGMGESRVAEILYDMMTSYKNPTIAPYCKTAEVRIRVTASADSHDKAEQMCDDAISEIKKTEVGSYIYGVDTDLASAVIESLKIKGLKITTAESCTGGLIAKMITDVSGASDVFEGGIVSYSNRIKNSLLNVSNETLKEHGAVSHQTAAEMAQGAKLAANADISIAVTGIAGPGGGTKDKPVGLVYIAVSGGKDTEVSKFNFGENLSRDKIRELTAIHALSLALEKIKKL